MRSFVGIDLGREPVPDETTVCRFRHLLEALPATPRRSSASRPPAMWRPRLRRSRALGVALPHRRFRGRNDPRHDIGLALKNVRHPGPDFGLPVIGLVDRLVERLALRFALEAAQPHIDGRIGLAAEAAADDHALRDLERNDLLFHDLDPFVDLAGPNLVLAQFVKGHLNRLPLAESYDSAS